MGQAHHFKVKDAKHFHREGRRSWDLLCSHLWKASHAWCSHRHNHQPRRLRVAVAQGARKQKPSPELLSIGRWRWENWCTQSLWDLPKLKPKNWKSSSMMDILGRLNQPPGQLVDWDEGEEGRTGERSVGEAFPGGTRERGFSPVKGWADSTRRERATSRKQVHTLYGKLLKIASLHLNISNTEKHVLWDSQNYKIPKKWSSVHSGLCSLFF